MYECITYVAFQAFYWKFYWKYEYVIINILPMSVLLFISVVHRRISFNNIPMAGYRIEKDRNCFLNAESRSCVEKRKSNESTSSNEIFL